MLNINKFNVHNLIFMKTLTAPTLLQGQTLFIHLLLFRIVMSEVRNTLKILQNFAYSNMKIQFNKTALIIDKTL